MILANYVLLSYIQNNQQVELWEKYPNIIIIYLFKKKNADEMQLRICINITSPNLRPYCNFCLPLHDKQLNRLTPLDLIMNVFRKESFRFVMFKTMLVSFKNLQNQFSPYYNFNNDQNLIRQSQIEIFIKGLGSIEECEKCY
ncbi:unnamed protein product [Paramecium octaurelia]|uniref:Uncharacterized protein n=1 Tax=Paramecium octaurelia TaxID=43137 RepID=A0A8S1YPK1_PAROT|nr:unnamed protein product [Paramecium octaurelia]